MDRAENFLHRGSTNIDVKAKKEIIWVWIHLNSLLLFAKAPIKGFVKTRLKDTAKLDDDEILALYVAFLKDTILTAEKTGSDTIYLSCFPREGKELMVETLKECFDGEPEQGRFCILPQEGRDFDERFTNAVGTVLEESGQVVVIGSDSPHIQPLTIDKAHGFLNETGGMVLGPSTEGGAYLVGITTPFDFTNVFTQGVELENLVLLAEEKQIPFLLLEELTDIDVETDLISFICRIKAMEQAARFSDFVVPRNTIQAIRNLGLAVKGGGGARERKLIRT